MFVIDTPKGFVAHNATRKRVKFTPNVFSAYGFDSREDAQRAVAGWGLLNAQIVEA